MSKTIKIIEARIYFDAEKAISNFDVVYTIAGNDDPDMTKKASLCKDTAYDGTETLEAIMDDIILDINTAEQIE